MCCTYNHAIFPFLLKRGQSINCMCDKLSTHLVKSLQIYIYILLKQPQRKGKLLINK